MRVASEQLVTAFSVPVAESTQSVSTPRSFCCSTIPDVMLQIMATTVNQIPWQYLFEQIMAPDKSCIGHNMQQQMQYKVGSIDNHH